MVAAVLLCGCAAGGTDPGANSRTSTAFELRLEKELRALASAAGEGDLPVAQTALHGRADAAADGRPAPPAPVPRIAGDDAAHEALTAARGRLVDALAAGAVLNDPAAAAVALATWDCWAAMAALRVSDRLRVMGGALADCPRRHAAAIGRLTGSPDDPTAEGWAEPARGSLPMREGG